MTISTDSRRDIAVDAAEVAPPDRFGTVALFALSTFETAHVPAASGRPGVTNHQKFDVRTCMTTDSERQNCLLPGDSHAAHHWLGLSSALPEVNIMQASASLCRPAVSAGSRYDTPFCRNVYDAICRDGRCDEFVQGDVPIQFDVGHLTAQGSIEVGRRLAPLFARKLARTGDASN